MKRLWIIEFVANAILIAIFYQWLGIRDSRASQLILSAVIALVIAAGTIWLHSRTFNQKPLHFGFMLLIFVLLYWGIAYLPLDRMGLWLASTLTLRSRKPVSPATVTNILNWVRWTIQWIVVPLLILRRKRPVVWLQFAAVVLAGFLIPHYLVNWTPKLESTAAQIASFIIRFGIAYCLVVSGFVAFSRLTASGNPEVSQPITAPLP